jgi:hypothetical protein
MKGKGKTNFFRSESKPPFDLTFMEFSFIDSGHFSYFVTSSSAAGKFNEAKQL